MYVKVDFGFEDLKKECWSGAVPTLEEIEKKGKEEEFMGILPEYFPDETPTLTEVNDLLWFEDETIFDSLGIKDEDE